MIGMDLIRSRRGLSAQIARELGVNSGAVAQWDRIPAERVVDIERITGIPRHMLRPDLHLDPDNLTPEAA
jgi:DNA-binding transcriptional regulator YdaS (Cro superfamily)